MSSSISLSLSITDFDRTRLIKTECSSRILRAYREENEKKKIDSFSSSSSSSLLPRNLTIPQQILPLPKMIIMLITSKRRKSFAGTTERRSASDPSSWTAFERKLKRKTDECDQMSTKCENSIRWRLGWGENCLDVLSSSSTHLRIWSVQMLFPIQSLIE